MRWHATASVLLAAALSFDTHAADSGMHASLSAQGLFGTHAPSTQALRLQGVFEGESALGRSARLRSAVHVESDPTDRLEPDRPRQANRSRANRRWLIDDDGAVELDELFLDTKQAGWDLRLGKQQTVWGTSDGIKVLDIVNPQSFREFIVDDYERSRIPLWALSAVHPLGDRGALELIAIPDLSFHDVPESGALFEITSPSLTPQASLDDVRVLSLIGAHLSDGSPALAALLRQADALTPRQLQSALTHLIVPSIEQRTERPPLRADTLEYGARLRGSLGAVEAAICVLRHFNDVPRAALDFRTDHVDITRSYLQSISFGAQISVPVGPTLVRFEGVYGTRAPIPALDFPDDDLSAVAPSYGAVVGVDLTVRDAGLVSVQLGELGLRTDSRHYAVPARNGFATVLWRDEIEPGRWVGEIFSAVSLQRGDLMLRGRLRWLLRDDLHLQIGLDAFAGDRAGVFGQFDLLDRVGAELIWSI